MTCFFFQALGFTHLVAQSTSQTKSLWVYIERLIVCGNTLCFIIFYLLCLNPLFSLNIDVQEHVFYNDDTPFVELNFFVLNISAKNEPRQGNPSILMTIIIKEKDNIIHAEKFNLIGEKLEHNFSTIKRYGLDFGIYSILVEAVDNNSLTNKFEWEKEVVVHRPASKVYFSDLQILANVGPAQDGHIGVKNGYLMEVLPFQYSQESMSNIFYYIEAYHTDQLMSSYDIVFTIADADRTLHKTIYQRKTKKRKAKKKDSIIGKIELSDLPSGNFKVVCHINDSLGNILITGESYFQHNSQKQIKKEIDNSHELSFIDIMDEDEMIYSLKAITPLLASIDLEAVNIAIQSHSKSKMIHELKYHWTQLSEISIERDYKEFMKIARAVDKTFQSGYGAGFETDRGFYYLKYGRPDDITGDKQEYDAPPYEIWTYNEIPELSQTNVKFVFYNPSLSPGNYELLHSTAKGEPNNANWKAILYKNTNDLNGSSTINSDNVNDGLRRNAGRNFDDF